jgi:hypothetical protein
MANGAEHWTSFVAFSGQRRRIVNSEIAICRHEGCNSIGRGTPLAGSPADFGKLISDETEKWAKAVKFAGIKPE